MAEKEIERALKKDVWGNGVSDSLTLVLLVVLAGVVLYGFVGFMGAGEGLGQKPPAAAQGGQEGTAAVSKSAEVEVYSLVNSECTLCLSVSGLADSIAGVPNVVVKKSEVLDFRSAEGAELVRKYNIVRLPSLIVLGDTANSPEFEEGWQNIGERRGDALVLTKEAFPAYDIKSGKVVGAVSAILVADSNCTKCFDMEGQLEQAKAGGIAIVNVSRVEASGDGGRVVLSRFNITKLPAVIFSNDISVYRQLADGWSLLGTVEPDGNYVWRNVPPPYLELPEGRMRGLVDIVSVTDASCADCYNTSLHRDALGGLGVVFSNESSHDIASEEGKALLAKYNITAVPTIVLSAEVAAYESLKPTLLSVGTFEPDGSYVFRNLSLISGAKYRKLGANATNASVGG